MVTEPIGEIFALADGTQSRAVIVREIAVFECQPFHRVSVKGDFVASCACISAFWKSITRFSPETVMQVSFSDVGAMAYLPGVILHDSLITKPLEREISGV